MYYLQHSPHATVHQMITKLRVLNFRNFEEKFLELGEGITVIVGPNASGKTNILESLYLTATGRSFRAKREEEMIRQSEEIGRVKARIVKHEGMDPVDLEVVLTRGNINGVHGKIARKKFLVNGVSKRLVDFAGNTKMVLFVPADLDLVTESPSLRRRFLDFAISQVDREYRRSLSSYEKGLRSRNKLLFKIREENISRSQLLFWDKLLIKNGDYISSKRAEFIDFINSRQAVGDLQFSLVYDKSAISEERIEQYAHAEVSAATTLVGPHRDDFIFIGNKENGIKNRELASFGSRGEQRMAVLWLKLSELSYIYTKTAESPSLLLDDIFSELDQKHREEVIDIAKNQQTIITTADPEFIKHFSGVDKIELQG